MSELEDDRSDYEDEDEVQAAIEEKEDGEARELEEKEAQRIKMSLEAPSITLNGNAVEEVKVEKKEVSETTATPLKEIAQPVRRSQRRKA